MEKRQLICPQNCYCVCGLEATVDQGVLYDIKGDRNHPYSRGLVCGKGSSFLAKQRHRQRLGYPLLRKRGKISSWSRISWEEAFNLLFEKIEGCKSEDGFSSIYYGQFSGSLGLQNRSLSFLMESLDGVTRIGNSLCYGAGVEGMEYVWPTGYYINPSEMGRAKHLLIWGANPAYTAFVQCRHLQQIKNDHGKIVVIDPFYSATARYADEHIQIRPGTDGALAMALAKVLLEKEGDDQPKDILGYEQYKQWVQSIDLQWASEETGISIEKIKQLAEEYGTSEAAAIWIGYGIQRYHNGGQTVRMIASLPLIANKGQKAGEGIYYSQQFGNQVAAKLADQKRKQIGKTNYISMEELLGKGKDIRLAIISNANPVAQFPEQKQVQKFLREVDFVVTLDHFLTETAQESDLILPITMFMERDDLHYSYWHNYWGYNQQAVEPWMECKLEFAIAKELSSGLRQRGIDCLSFDELTNEKEFLHHYFGDIVQSLDGVEDFEQLAKGGYYHFLPPEQAAGQLISSLAEERGFGLLPQYQSPKGKKGQYRLVTLHSNILLNSQFANIDYLAEYHERKHCLMVHPKLAQRHGLIEGSKGRIYNLQGEAKLPIKIMEDIDEDTIFFYQGNKRENKINELIALQWAPMGGQRGTMGNIAYHDTFVYITKA